MSSKPSKLVTTTPLQKHCKNEGWTGILQNFLIITVLTETGKESFRSLCWVLQKTEERHNATNSLGHSIIIWEHNHCWQLCCKRVPVGVLIPLWWIIWSPLATMSHCARNCTNRAGLACGGWVGPGGREPNTQSCTWAGSAGGAEGGGTALILPGMSLHHWYYWKIAVTPKHW